MKKEKHQPHCKLNRSKLIESILSDHKRIDEESKATKERVKKWGAIKESVMREAPKRCPEKQR